VSELLDSLRRATTASFQLPTHRPVRAADEILFAPARSGALQRPAAARLRNALVTGAAGIVIAVSVYGFASVHPRSTTWRSNHRAPEPSPAGVASTHAAGIEHNSVAAAERPNAAVPPAVTLPQAAAAPRPRRQARDDFARAVEHQRQGDFDTAAAVYQSLLARDELPAQVHNNLGLIHQAKGEIDLAVRDFEAAIARDPEYGRAYGNLGVALLARNQVDLAADRLRTAAELDPSDPAPLVNLALVQKAAGKPALARETLLAALVLSPHHAPAHYNLAVLCDQAGERALAVEHYRAFLEHRGDEYAARAADARARLAALDARR
jgi:Tfp pilus assembly protein PilF